jgi:hypothetical protein
MATDKNTASTADATTAQAALLLGAATISSQATQQMNGLTLVRQAKINQLQRQATALAAQSGATDPTVVALQATIKTQQVLAAQLGAAKTLVSTNAPAVPSGGWVVYGYVRDQNLQPVAQLTVFLVNEQKIWLRGFGYAFTSETGYFEIDYSPPASALKKRAKAGSKVAGETAAAVSAAGVTAYLEVLNQKRQPLYIDSSSFSIAVGNAIYRDVILTGQTPLGAAPPGASTAPSAAK